MNLLTRRTLEFAIVALFWVFALPSEAAAKAARKSLHCPTPQGWLMIRQSDPAYVVFGELHGTVQAPLFVGNLACSEALQNRKVLVALELSAASNEELQRAWNLSSGSFELALGRLGWTGRADGVASHAMFSLIARLHALKELGLPIAVAAYGGFRNKQQYDRFSSLPGQGRYEAAQAENIYEAVRAERFETVLVLTGNFHAMTTSVTRGEVTFDPMARRLAAYGKVVSLDMRYGNGANWSCHPRVANREPGKPLNASDIVCGQSSVTGNGEFSRSPFMSFGQAGGNLAKFDYDGIFWVGSVESSPPMFK